MVSRTGLPRGFRDFPPEVMSRRLEVLRKIRETFLLYGFPSMETPSLEYWRTLKDKYGVEAESRLLWRFKDPFSNKMYALRYDLTVPLARYISMHPEVPLPFKRHQIGLVWRHEEPQRGRYREFVQADIDTVGSPYIEADAEIINALVSAIEKIGVTDFKVRINHRGLLRMIFEKKIGLRNPLGIYRVIDKLDKMGIEGVGKELEKIGVTQDKIKMIMRVIETVVDSTSLNELDKLLPLNTDSKDLIKEIDFLISCLEKPGKIKLDLSMVRGLDYYTGVIFEFNVNGTGGQSIAGGGRYDNLIGLFNKGESIPATGGSLGFERIMNIILKKKGYAKKTSSTVFIVSLTDSARKEAWRTASKLRLSGVPVEVDLMRRNAKKQKKRVQALGIRYILYIGEKELADGKLVLYDRETGLRNEYTVDEIIDIVKKG